MAIDQPVLEQVLVALGAVLASRGSIFEIVVVGGSGLLLLGLAERTTRDLDVLAIVSDGRYGSSAPLPSALAMAARDVAGLFGLSMNWLNPGPTSLLDFGLPVGFTERVATRRYGGLIVHVASRLYQICLKLHAAADQGSRSKHAADLEALAATPEELLFAARWALTQDESVAFRRVLLEALVYFGVSDADGHI